MFLMLLGYCVPESLPVTLGYMSFTGVTEMYKVDTGIDVPDSRTKYPFTDMGVGDSILFEEKKTAESARVASLRFARAHRGEWVFSLRKVDNGWRLWRIR